VRAWIYLLSGLKPNEESATKMEGFVDRHEVSEKFKVLRSAVLVLSMNGERRAGRSLIFCGLFEMDVHCFDGGILSY
jgi:hypothetical protein